jgi:hypothetical protein
VTAKPAPKPKPAAPRGVERAEAAFQASPPPAPKPTPTPRPVPSGITRAEEQFAPPATPTPRTAGARFDGETTPTPIPTETPTPPRSPTSTPTPVVTLTPKPRDPTKPLPGLSCEPGDVYWDDVANWIGYDGRAAAGYVRAGVRAAEVVLAAPKVDIIQTGPMVRIYGPQSARSALSFNRMTNWIGADNIDDLATTKLASWGSVAGFGVNIVADTALYSSGEYDRHEYAAALTVDTGFTAAMTLASAAVSGAITGAIVGGGAGTIALPLVGTVSGAVLGAVIGAAVGIVLSVGLGRAFSGSGARDYVVDSVSDLYRDWTGEEQAP